MAARPLRQIRRHAVEVVVRQHDAAAGRGREQIGEVRLPLDVDVLGAKSERLPEDRPPLLFGAPELSAFPRAAGT